MIKICVILLVFLTSVTEQLPAQSNKEKDREQVLLAVNDYVDAFYNGEIEKLKRSVSPKVYKYGYFRARGSKEYKGELMTYQQMIDYSKQVKERPIPKSAPRKIEILDIKNKTAVARLIAWWGLDYVLLAKHADKWMIVQVLWQSRPAKMKK